MLMDLEAWLDGLGLDEYAQPLRDQRIDLDVLPSLTDADLRELGVSALGDRKRLLAAISALSSENSAEPPLQPAPEIVSAEFSRHGANTPREFAAGRSLVGERKLVTILFADVVGSTLLTEKLGAEDALSKLQPALDAMMSAVRRYNGTVNKVQGDGIMAIFGAPIAYEDHALRACFASLAIQEKLAEINEKGGCAETESLQVRTGLHSGEVVVKAIRNDLSIDYDAVGPTVNLASRMEQSASPGEIRLTERTMTLAEDFVAVQAVGDVPMKGFSEPVKVYRLCGRNSEIRRPDVRRKKAVSPFVDRRNELAILDLGWSAATRGRGNIITVSGEPGVGKSRLLEEYLRAQKTDGATVLWASAMPFSRDVPWSYVRGLIGPALDLHGSEDRAETISKISNYGTGARAQPGQWTGPLLAVFDFNPDDEEWLNLSAGQRRRGMIQAVVALLETQAEINPLVLILENLQWCDQESLAVVEAILPAVARSSIFMICSYRPGFHQNWTLRSDIREIRLQPLMGADLEQYFRVRLGEDQSLVPLKRLLAGTSLGIPLYLEEYIASLVRDGTLVGSEGAYQLGVPIDSLKLPAGIESLIAAQIDQLGPTEKQVLQVLALSEQPLSVYELMGTLSCAETQMTEALAALEFGQLIDAAQLYPEAVYGLRHAVIGDAAKSALVHETRLGLHAGLAKTIEALHPDAIQQNAERLARHYSAAEMGDQSALYHIKAADKAIDRYAYRQAIAFAEAAAQESCESTLKIEAYELIGNGMSLLNEVEKANAAYARAIELCDNKETAQGVRNRQHHLRFAQRPGSRIAYYEQGADGPTLLLVSPLAYGIANFQPLVQMVCQTYRTVSVIPRGMVPSDPLPETGRYPYGEQIADLARVIETLDRGKVIGVGLSRGATQMISLAAKRPDLIDRLILVGASPDLMPLDKAEDTLGAWDQEFLDRLDSDFENAMHDIAKAVFSEPEAEELAAEEAKALIATPISSIRHFMLDVPRGCAKEVFGAVQCPVLLAHGEKDIMDPIEEAYEVLSMLPNAQLYIFKGRGHFPVFTAPNEFRELLDRFVMNYDLAGTERTAEC
jgi:class 3 adenylate cyclase/pimeloyl-ACP methyl ester carboxylesterase